jgi:hypothetical protein
MHVCLLAVHEHTIFLKEALGMRHNYHRSCMVVFLFFFLVCGIIGCSKTDDPGKTGPKDNALEQASARAIGKEELKQIYLAFIDEFQLKPFGQENEERYSQNQAAASKAIEELESISGNIKDSNTQALHNKFLGLLQQYNEAASVLETALRETKAAKEDLDRRENEVKEKMENAGQGSKEWADAFREKSDIIKERSNLADYSNIGTKKSKVESIETALYWLHKEFGIEGLKK